MDLLATGHMLADVVAIMGKCFLRPHYIFPLESWLFSGQSRVLLVENHRILLKVKNDHRS